PGGKQRTRRPRVGPFAPARVAVSHERASAPLSSAETSHDGEARLLTSRPASQRWASRILPRRTLPPGGMSPLSLKCVGPRRGEPALSLHRHFPRLGPRLRLNSGCTALPTGGERAGRRNRRSATTLRRLGSHPPSPSP